MCIRDRYKTVRKLEAMTDAEFEELYIMPDGMVDDRKEDAYARIRR